MAEPIKVDEYHTPETLCIFIQSYSQIHGGFFHVVLVKESGQGYNAVFHAGGKHPKLRIALGTESSVQPTGRVRDIVEKVLGTSGKFSSEVDRIVDSTLLNSNSHVVLVVQHGLVEEAHANKGEWP